MDRQLHWDTIYRGKDSDQLSWYQQHLQLSLELIQCSGIGLEASLIDVGGGDATLVDDLLELGYMDLTVLDVSPAALVRARQRLGSKAEGVSWIEADITRVDLPANAYDLWHDRAVLHFLSQPDERAHYTGALNRALKAGGTAILSGFAPDGPERCSGLDVFRIEPERLCRELGSGFHLRDTRLELHSTPSGVLQKFIYCLFQKD